MNWFKRILSWEDPSIQHHVVLPANQRIDWSQLAGICYLKNEADIINSNLEHLIKYGMKYFILYDDGSTDRSKNIIEEINQRYTDVNIIIIQAVDNFVKKTKILNRLVRLSGDIFNVKWAFCFDADDFLWLSPGRRINLSETMADYILLPWLHISPDADIGSYIASLSDSVQLRNVIVHKCKVIIRISETTEMKGGQHNIINNSNMPAIGLDGLTLGIASVHFPVRSKRQILSKYVVTKHQRNMGEAWDNRYSKHRNTIRNLSVADAEKLYSLLIRRDKNGFIEFCEELAVSPKMFDYIAPMICADRTSFPHPGEEWKFKRFPKLLHYKSKSTTLGMMVGAVARWFIRFDSAYYKAATPDEIDRFESNREKLVRAKIKQWNSR